MLHCVKTKSGARIWYKKERGWWLPYRTPLHALLGIQSPGLDFIYGKKKEKPK